MKRILVVDDNSINRKLAVALLNRHGWEAMEAESGEGAIAVLADEIFDAVLLDISMPGMDGETVCQQIRADPRLAGLRVVAYTAHAMEHEKRRIMSAGFDDIVIKPMTPEVLYAALQG
ncbi:MAG: response regulator [Rhodocyclaceae bacterium]